MNVRTKFAASALLVGLLAFVCWWLHETGTLMTIMDASALQARVDQMGSWGPVAVVVVMMLAILISPIPSAPIALAADAVY